MIKHYYFKILANQNIELLIWCENGYIIIYDGVKRGNKTCCENYTVCKIKYTLCVEKKLKALTTRIYDRSTKKKEITI